MISNTKRSIARALLEIGAVGFSPQAPNTFKSGIVSPVYVDNRRLIYHPQQWHVIIAGFKSFIESQGLQYDVIAGVAVGGVPHSSALAYLSKKPAIFVRKETKGHGMAQRVEGGDVAGKTVLLLEDLVTTGGSCLSGIDAIRKSGAIVDDVVAIVSYGFAEATSAFTQAGVKLHTLTDLATILDLAQDLGMFSANDAGMIRDWFKNPHSWKPGSS